MMLYFFAFLSGLVTIFAPCIWPLLPIILSGGIHEGHRRPLGIIVGISISFLFATLLLALLLQSVPLDPEIFRLSGVVIIIFFGVTLLFPSSLFWIEAKMSRALGFLGVVKNTGNGFWSGCITGLALGLVWSPCAGPILATVATVAATQGVNFMIFFIALFFILGLSVPLFGIALLGQKIFFRMRKANKYTASIQRVFGIIVIATGLMIYTGYDQVFQDKFLEVCGAAGSWLTSFENNDNVVQQLRELRTPSGVQQ